MPQYKVGFLIDENTDLLDMKSPYRMMTLKEMLKADGNKRKFCTVVVGDYLIDSTKVGTDDITVVAKYLIQPFEEQKLKFPLGVYLAALTSDTYAWEHQFNVNKGAEFKDGTTHFDITTVKEWVDAYLYRYTESENRDLLELLVEKRIELAVADIKLRISPELAEFVERSIDPEYVLDIYQNSDSYVEVESTVNMSGVPTKVLFKIGNDEEDEAFREVDKLLKMA